jgi:serine protease Do
MKQACRKLSILLLAAAFVSPVIAQEDKGEKDVKVKESKDKKNVEEIVIVRKGDKTEKVVVEINGDKVTVNGKPIEDLKDGDVTVRRHNIKDAWAYADGLRSLNGSYDNMAKGYNVFNVNVDSNRAMLGVTTEKAESGVSIESITKESAASKAGLKEGDIITKVDDKAITNPDDLSAAIKKHKAGEKVTVTYLRDKVEGKVTAELGKWKGTTIFSSPGNFKMEMDDMNLGNVMPRIQATPRVRGGYASPSHGGSTPKLGLSVQDSDDGKGVKVLSVDEESNAAKAGLKENDTITEFDGKTVNSADEVAKLVRESKDKVSVMVKVQRNGKSQNIELRMPRKLKTADL